MDATDGDAYRTLRNRVWDADDGDDNDAALSSLAPLERAIYVTRELEDELSDGGWYLVFANENDYLIEAAIEGYELLGLPDYANHLREVRRSGYGEGSSEDEGDRLDALYAGLAGSEESRVQALREAGLTR